MSWLSLMVIALAGLVSSLSAVAISAVILLVIGQATFLVYRHFQPQASKELE